jgi:hypothetical protein
LDGYSWCQDKSRPNDEYSGRCVSYPNGPNPWQPHEATPHAAATVDSDSIAVSDVANGSGSDQDSADWGMCADASQLIFQPQDCASLEAHFGQWKNWHGAKAGLIAFGILKFILITVCICCCVRKCRKRCQGRCQQWREKHCRGAACQNNNSINNNNNPINGNSNSNNGSNVSVQDGCSFVGNSSSAEEVQMQQAMSNSVNKDGYTQVQQIPPV